MNDGSLILLSRGVLANICATERASEILAVQPYHYAIVDTMLESLPALWSIPQDKEIMIGCQGIVQALLKDELLHVYSLQREQHFRMSVLLGRHMREELADLFTLADLKHAEVGLDDPVIRKRVSKLLPTISIQSTLAILHHWYKTRSLPANEMHLVLQRVFQYAHFQPPSDDALFSWWQLVLYNRVKYG